MGMSKKSTNNILSDKETQSPMLKIFKDIMQRERNDSEKVNLIKIEKLENKKRKTYSGPLPKTDLRSCDSSSTERFKHSHGSKMPIQDLEQQMYKECNDRTQTIPFNAEKKDNWWFWKDSEKKKVTDDTCSCVSCAEIDRLKKVISSDYACIFCLSLMFAISVVVAFVIFRSVAVTEGISPQIEGRMSSALKKNTMIKSRRQFRSDGTNLDGNKPWTDITDPWQSLPSLSGTDFGETGLRDGTYNEESYNKVSGTISQILDADKFFDGPTSEKLRDFYKRLIQTDARIRKLKQQTEEASDITKPLPDRYKRSLMSIETPINTDTQRISLDTKVDLSKFNLFYPPFVAVKDSAFTNQKPRFKKSDEDPYSNQPSGIVIENKKLMVQYGPFDRKRNFPKCSHMLKDSKSHEKQLKHPFYKNSQRLDELLGQMLEHNLDKVVANPFNLDLWNGEKDKCKHSKDEQEVVTKAEEEPQKQISYPPKSDDSVKLMGVKRRNGLAEGNPSYIEKEAAHINDEETDELFFPSTTPKYGVVLSVSTFINADSTEESRVTKNSDDSSINRRKLLQLNEEDEENLAYEDFKEVLADYTDTHDETDKQVERDRRSDNSVISGKQSFANKYDISLVHNPNWKSPMQLYPDELNLLIKNSGSSRADSEFEKGFLDPKDKVKNTDTDYVEEYLNSKYSKLAQAYSDYGVLAAKKDYVTNEMNLPTDNVIHHEFPKSSTEKENNVKQNLIKKRRNAQMHELNTQDVKYPFAANNMTTSRNILKITEFGPEVNEFFPKIKISSELKELRNMEKNDNETQIHRSDATLFRKLRSLKSIETEESKDALDLKSNKKFTVPNTEEEINNTSFSNNGSVEGPGEILRVFSDWFLTLAKLSGEFKDNSTVIQENSTILNTSLLNTYEPENVTKDFMYPMYDADMIENIGHRSRVLMSIEDKSGNTSLTTTINNTKVEKSEKINKENIKENKGVTTKLPPANQTTTIKHENASVNANSTSQDKKVNRTVVKRSADSNLIFWNDIYDDEYGVKIDYLDNEARNKHSVDNENFMKRSGQWINKKFRKLGESLRTGYNSRKNYKRQHIINKTNNREHNFNRFLRKVKDLRPKNYYKRDESGLLYSKKKKYEDDESENYLNFASMTAKMKQICHEAAKAVEKTRNINIRESEGGEEVVATSLMQQLVKLMTDLVDFQVQQKTCSRLPQDLSDFLQWLTSPPGSDESKDTRFDMILIASPLNDTKEYKTSESPLVEIADSILKEETDPKSECLNILQSVRELLRLYDELSYEEKGKLLGIKEYLENQRNFLLKILSAPIDLSTSLDVLKMYRKRNTPARFKRFVSQKKGPNKTQTRRKETPMKRINKFTKTSETKRTKTTMNQIDSMVVTEGVRKKKQKLDKDTNENKSTTAHHKIETKTPTVKT
ncbi:PREDICTED: uncharacterized protein LOC106124963 [Papilio xuthus]|uniref:Uncharacterized protein LOC106124963 n=1 Tax=Papilio xuthus TaxID=66420 RepID=A0AAJ7EHE0_PAPXU|nr:PREDICTED: uncharacterized protein LOC106124963 [Papilio xuthus]